MTPCANILAWEIPWLATVHGVTKGWTQHKQLNNSRFPGSVSWLVRTCSSLACVWNKGRAGGLSRWLFYKFITVLFPFDSPCFFVVAVVPWPRASAFIPEFNFHDLIGMGKILHVSAWIHPAKPCLTAPPVSRCLPDAEQSGEQERENPSLMQATFQWRPLICVNSRVMSSQ